MNKIFKQAVIFLDVDGVLTSMRCNGYFDFDLWAVSFLRYVCDNSNTKIVMSSAWRVLPDAKKIFTKTFGKHLHEDWRTKENFLKWDTRGEEINEWLSRHPEVDHFVVVDDTLHGLESHREWLVLTSIEDGLLMKHMVSILDRLNIRKGLPRLEPVFNDPVCFYTRREKRTIGYDGWVSELQERNARKQLDELITE